MLYEVITCKRVRLVELGQMAGIVQERNGSRLPFTAPRNTYRTRDDKWVSISYNFV